MFSFLSPTRRREHIYSMYKEKARNVEVKDFKKLKCPQEGREKGDWDDSRDGFGGACRIKLAGRIKFKAHHVARRGIGSGK